MGRFYKKGSIRTGSKKLKGSRNNEKQIYENCVSSYNNILYCSDGEFNSVETLQAYIKRFGVFAPVMLTVIQAAQVVVPILPGFLGCSVGAVMFGCIGGFCCNYIGIVAGSLAAFVLARKFGIKLVESIFPKDKIKK